VCRVALFVGFEIETVVSRVVFFYFIWSSKFVCISAELTGDGMITDLKMRKKNDRELQK